MTKHVDDKELSNVSGAGGAEVEQNPPVGNFGGDTSTKPTAPGDPGDAPDTDAGHEGGYIPGQG